MRRFFYILGILATAFGVFVLAALVFGGGVGPGSEGLMVLAFIVAGTLFLIGKLFPAPADTTAASLSSARNPSAVRVEHTKKHSALEKMAWLATIAAAIVALMAYLGGR